MRHVIPGQRNLDAQNDGMLTDGLGVGGHNGSASGTDITIVQALPGQRAQLDLHALWMAQQHNVRVVVDDAPETVLRGTELPKDDTNRTFLSKPGGALQVMLVRPIDTDTGMSFVSFAVRAVCVDRSGCSAHSSNCIQGNCTCDAGWIGSACTNSTPSTYK